MSVLCKIWSFILGMFVDTLDAVAVALKTVGEVALDLVKGVGDAVGSAAGSIFGGSNRLVWALAGTFAYFFFFRDDDKNESVSLQ